MNCNVQACTHFFITLKTGKAYKHQWTGPSLIQVIPCHMCSTKPMPEPVVNYCQLHHQGETLKTFEQNQNVNIYITKCIWIGHLQKCWPFCSDFILCDVIMVWTEHHHLYLLRRHSTWALIQYKHVVLPIKEIVEIRRSWDHLISTMGFPILVRWHLYIEWAPWCTCSPVKPAPFLVWI